MNNQLWQVLAYAVHNIPFYKKTIGPGALESPCPLPLFPIIKKIDMRNHLSDFISRDIIKYDYFSIFDMNKDYLVTHAYTSGGNTIYVEYTSGSSGEPMLCIKTKAERTRSGIALWRKRNAIHAILPGKFFVRIHNNNIYPFPFSPATTEQERIVNEVEYLAKSDYEWWHISTNKLNAYSLYARDNGIHFDKLRAVEYSTAFLSKQERREYKNILGRPIVCNYGCREIWNIGYDCVFGNLHVNEENVHLELVDEDEKTILEREKIGKVVITGLNQFFMPFIRYQLDDYAYYEMSNCACGKKTLVLLPGRNTIVGTSIYGNQVFREVIINLAIQYQMNRFDAINIVQNERDVFCVNISGNREKPSELQEKFIYCTVNKLKQVGIDTKYEFRFTYNNEQHFKSIFQSITQ